MDGDRFDSLARTIGQRLSRRRAFGALGFGSLAWLGLSASSPKQRVLAADTTTGEDDGPCCGGNRRICCPSCDYRHGEWCSYGLCRCFPGPSQGTGGSVILEVDAAGTVIAASTTGVSPALLRTDQQCDTAGCTGTIIVFDAVNTAPALTVTARVDAGGAIELGLASDVAIYGVSTDPRAEIIVSAVGNLPPVEGTFDPQTGDLKGDWICGDSPLPVPASDVISSAAPALLAIAGEQAISEPRRLCPPGSPGPRRPFPPLPDPQTVNICYTACDIATSGAALLCCAETGLLLCPGCLAAGEAANKLCHGLCDGAGGAAPVASGSGAGGTDEVTAPPPTAKATPTPGGDAVAEDAGTSGAGAATAPASPTPTPAAPRPCTSAERPCGGQCVSLTDCPESCCLNDETCSCVCPDCVAPFVVVPETCGCVCGLIECSPNHVFDREACTCTCGPQECPANHVFNETLCGCVCAMQCPPNFVFDEANCACLCATECPPTFVFDEATCSCVCELAGCPPNLTFTPESCACFCDPPACPPGFFVDQASCACFCQETACTEGQVFDLASCACVASGAGSAVGDGG